MEAAFNATIVFLLKPAVQVPERENPGDDIHRGQVVKRMQPSSVCHDLDSEMDGCPLPLAKRPRVCASPGLLASVLKVDDNFVKDVVTTSFSLREAGLTGHHKWQATIERPRSAWRDINVLPHLEAPIRSMYEAPWSKDDFHNKRSKFLSFTSMIFGLPLSKQLLGISSNARVLRGQRHGHCRALKCGWCAQHVKEAIDNNNIELCLNKLWRNGACTRLDAAIARGRHNSQVHPICWQRVRRHLDAKV